MVILAREAALSDFGRTLSPLINTEKKGGAFPMLLQQFRRAVAVGIVRGNALLKNVKATLCQKHCRRSKTCTQSKLKQQQVQARKKKLFLVQ